MTPEIIIEGFYDFADSRTSHQVIEMRGNFALTTCGCFLIASEASKSAKPKCKKCLKYLRHEK